MELSDGTLPLSLAIVEGGALLDLPSAELFGYPSSSASVSGDSARLSFAFGSGTLTISAALSGDAASGAFRQGSGETASGGAVSLRRSTSRDDSAWAFSFEAPDGARLAGTLLVPEASSAPAASTAPEAPRPPLVILHAGLGAADRDGNNYNVPGRNDALRQLADALLSRGVASYRYDKRGSGAATWLVGREEDLSLEAWIRDLEAAAEALAATGRFSGTWLLGLNDGALVAAAAANAMEDSGAPASGLLVACASADGSLDSFRKAVAGAPEEARAEGEAIVAALLEGRRVETLSEFYAAAFRPSFQPYLIEAFRRDIETELGTYGGACLIAQGNMDMHATLADMMALSRAKPDAVTVMPRRMNHVLKDVSQDVDENLDAFSNPDYPISAEFADAVAEFVGLAAD